MNHIGRKTVAQNARLSLETMQHCDSRYNTTAINGLIESFRRIEDNESWTPEQALQDHFNAMTDVANNASDLALIKASPFLFRNCESTLNYLVKIEGARYVVQSTPLPNRHA
jgi:hypothetical protein